MGKTKLIIGLVLVSMGPFLGVMQNYYNVETIEMSYAECGEGILKSDLTIALSIASHVEVVHSFKEARAFLIRTKGESNVMVMFPNATRVEMDETFCDQSQAEKDRTLLAAVQAELLD